jgi:large conductance mechanosensitive channel
VKDLVYTFQAPVLDGSVKMVELKWGMFIQTMLDFIIIAFAIFIFIKLISKATKKKSNPETPPP